MRDPFQRLVCNQSRVELPLAIIHRIFHQINIQSLDSNLFCIQIFPSKRQMLAKAVSFHEARQKSERNDCREAEIAGFGHLIEATAQNELISFKSHEGQEGK